jgi:DNA gyrase/topoisomerase IV subunit A
VIDIRETGRSAQGVRVMRLNEDIRIACVTVVVKQEEVAAEASSDEPEELVGAGA